MSNSPSKGTALKAFTRFTLDSSTPSLWRVTFDHPPINLIDSVMIRELGELFTEVERNEGPAVLVFDSADPDYFLAHYDITPANRSLVDLLPKGPTGFHPWVDIVVRLGKLPAVTISAIRGRARGAGSEFVLASDIRFASRERAAARSAGSRLRRCSRRRPNVLAASFGRTGSGVRDPARRRRLRRRACRAVRVREPRHSRRPVRRLRRPLRSPSCDVRPSGPGRYQALRQRRRSPGGCRISTADGRILASRGAPRAAGAGQKNVRTRPTTTFGCRTTPRRVRGTDRQNRSVASVHQPKFGQLRAARLLQTGRSARGMGASWMPHFSPDASEHMS